MEMVPFSKIGQFKQTIKDVCWIANNEGKEAPTITFTGKVKMHGTNAGISYIPGEPLSVQSRKRIITVTDDNAGFALFVEERKADFEVIMQLILLSNEGTRGAVHNYIPTLFGEWCGGNIQKGIALNELPKMFVIFGVKYVNVNDPDDCYYTETPIADSKNLIYNIADFLSYRLDIDFNFPQIAQQQMIEWVMDVESCCPVGKHFGVSGIGEGIVFSSFDENGHRTHIFKVKGQKHSSSNVKTLASVDLDKMKDTAEFVEYTCTANRCNQAIEQVFTGMNVEPSRQGTGDFIKWVVEDIIAEETDTMLASNLEPRDVGKAVSKKAKNWFFAYIDRV